MRAIVGPLVIVGLLVTLWALFVRGNPGGISDAQYSEFSRLAPPKLLYSCTRKRTQEALLREIQECANSGRSGCDLKAYETGESEAQSVVEFVSGQGISAYDALLRDARLNCGTESGSMAGGTLIVLESHKD
jgi:hypothetical protein